MICHCSCTDWEKLIFVHLKSGKKLFFPRQIRSFLEISNTHQLTIFYPFRAFFSYLSQLRSDNTYRNEYEASHDTERESYQS